MFAQPKHHAADEATSEAIAFLLIRGYLLDVDFTSGSAVTLAGSVALMEGFGPVTSTFTKV